MTVVRPYLLNINKPPGMTSHQVVRDFKRNLPKPFGKIGHLGTLDPFAQGVLLVALGGGQRMNDLIHQWYPKSYRAQGILGVQTATGDMTVTPSWEDRSDTFKQLEARPLAFYQECSQSFVGEYWQAPPAYSASKFQGRPLHVWARQGVPILKDPVRREVQQIAIVKLDFPQVEFTVTVSSGTYIRTLFEDMAKKMGTYGALCSLERVAIGPFHIHQALSQEQWPGNLEGWQWRAEDQLHVQIPLAKICPSVRGVQRYCNGHPIDESTIERIVPEGVMTYTSSITALPVWVMGREGELLGMANWENRGGQFLLIPKINFYRSI